MAQDKGADYLTILMIFCIVSTIFMLGVATIAMAKNILTDKSDYQLCLEACPHGNFKADCIHSCSAVLPSKCGYNDTPEYHDDSVEEIRENLKDSDAIREFCKSEGYKSGYPTSPPAGRALGIYCYEKIPSGYREKTYDYEDYIIWKFEDD